MGSLEKTHEDCAHALTRLTHLLEAASDEMLPHPDDPALTEFGAARLVESMRYSLGTPGKRLRPLLLLATAEALGGPTERLAGFAVGLEMIHAYSLIHDDLPAMDDDDLRRGHPTNHKVFGDGMAILAGDGLLTEAFLVMLQPVGDPERQAHVIGEIARAAGREGMVGGQAADLLAEEMEPELEILRSIHIRKTGALLRASVRAGAELAGASTEDLAVLTDFAIRFGLAFQIADDIKDVVAPPQVTGKQGGGDRTAGKMTYPALMGVESAREHCREELEAAIAALAPLGERGRVIEYLARDSVAPAFAGTEG